MNWNLDIISPTTAFGNSAVWGKPATTAAFVIKPLNPIPPFLNLNLDFNQFTVRGWLTGRRPAQGVLYPRGVYNR